ncbi:MAG TPA: sialate O-acetylesterase [Candidatus Hydrogenedentes bacterium]|nr:sialate O-acetylesterase [Candidatus Hydrogenedentota bacterium]HQM47605.1 sialate O-acetylesterase [Candidatus Hydrogenedentota bacterium]
MKKVTALTTCLITFATLLLATLLTGAPCAAAAELRLPAVFADHAVLQQNARVPVWGWGEPGETITVAIAGQTATAIAGTDGRWQADLAPMTAGGPHELVVTAGSGSKTFSDILIGEVWLASGQSNMQWSIKNTDGWEEEQARCANDKIRIAMVFRTCSPVPLNDLQGWTPWAPCNAESLANCCNGEGFSGVSYYFAKHLQAGLGVPVGIINTSWGGTRIEPWTPPAGFEPIPSLAGIVAQIRVNQPNSAEYQQLLTEAIAKVEAWIPEAQLALQNGVFPPALPAIASASALINEGAPTTLYNAMVAPLVPYANRGFIWYQGESNRGESMLYRDKMEALIKGWRTVWQQDDLACYFVQLAPYDYGNSPQALPEIWEAQAAAAEIPGAGMAVVNDIGNLTDIHPTNKDDVGKRLALQALNKTYGKTDVVCESPLFDRFEVQGNAMRVYFKHAKSLSTRDGAAPTWFQIFGPDGAYREATAAIDGTSVVLTAESVAMPVAVCFAWNHCALPNLMNEAGLPAPAFRAGTIPIDGALRANVPESEGFELVYALDPTNLTAENNKPRYDEDRHESLAGRRIARVAYYLQLVGPDNQARWVYAEMDPFTQDLAHIGVPIPDAGAQYQQDLANLFVKTNIEGLPSGALPGGVIELWACNYGAQCARSLPEASNDRYDFDDTMSMATNPGYGCLQIHDAASKTTLLAFNNPMAGRGADVGIGNCPGENPDWTFAHNAGSYINGRLIVLVKTASE